MTKPLAMLMGALMAAGLATAAAATTTTYTFGVPLNDSSAYPMPSDVFASLDVTSGNIVNGKYYYDFTLTAYDLNDIFYTGAYISDLLMNTTTADTSVKLVSGSVTSGATGSATSTGTVGGVKVTTTNQSTGSVSWNFDASFPNSGANGVRLSANEWVKWSAYFNAPLLFEDPAFGLHVNAMNSAGNSAWYEPGTPPAVPLPASLPLFVSGLGLLGVFARRRMSA